MKILVVNAWHDDNRGDQALVHSTISLLQKNYPAAQLRVLSMIPSDHPYWPRAHLSLQQEFPDIAIIPSPLPMDAAGTRLTDIPKLALSLLSVVLPKLSLFTPFKAIVAEYDLVVSVGGHYFFTINNNTKSLLRLLRLALPLQAANQMQKRSIIFSQSLGPYHGFFAKKLMSSVFSKSRIFVRESLSADLVRQYVANADVSVKPDSAFLLGLYQQQHYAFDAGSDYAIITLREPMHGDVGAIRDNYLAELKQAALTLLSSGTVKKIAVFPHVTGPTVLEDDRCISQEFTRLCASPAVQLIDENYSIKQCLEFYRNARFVIGTRFHSVVFSLCQGTPAVAISYYGPKAQGIMNYIDMAGFCLYIEQLNATDLLNAVSKVRHKQQQVQQIKQKMIQELLDVKF